MAVPAQAEAPAQAPAASQDTASTPGQTGANAPATPASPTPPSGAEPKEQASRGPDLFREAFSRIRGVQRQSTERREPAPQAPTASPGSAKETERPASSRPDAPAAAPVLPEAATAEPSTTPDKIVLTPEELQRRVQSEADRVLAKRQADERARREKEEERELRDTDPWEYARRVKAREEEQAKQHEEISKATTLLSEQLTLYDRQILDVFFRELPEPARKKVLDGAANLEGIPHRSQIAKDALQTLRQQWVTEGREQAKSALMKDPTFIKEVLARHGGVRTQEPESVPALPSNGSARPRNGNEAVNSWMRQSFHATREVTGRGSN